MNGKFIVFEGPDGSGKTTILKKVNEVLTNQGYKVNVFREPGGTKISEKIRDIIIDNDNKEMADKTEALLFAASRAQLVEEKFKPLLNKGEIIFSDRYVLSSLTYQGVGRKLGIKEVEEINNFATSGIKPDITIFFDIDYKEALLRKRANFSADRLENEDFQFHKDIFDAYLDMAEKFKEDIVKIDASLSVDEVTDNVLSLIYKILED
ncbi:dTMP kinase [Anaerococcus sp. Marseille-P9784]|uniref:dTMP kinase n=1 Tax=Anaerococcus sp. Marseille-P9784 TaxID=2614127 RepID=UPI00124A5E56|nr:dTMP kinase [Anaerococcus sp. Marseille-P9784]